MWRRILTTALALAVLLAMPLAPAFPAADESPPPATSPTTTSPADEQDHERLRELRRVYERAVNEENVDLLQPHLAADFSGVMVTGDAVANMNDLRAYWQKIRNLLGPGGKYTVELHPDLSRLYGDIAVAKGTTKEVAVTDEGKRYEFSSQWTAVCRKEGDGGAWKVVRIHGSMDPVGNPFVKTFIGRASWFAGGVGAGLGVLVGGLAVFLVTRLRRKDRPAAS